MTPTVVLNLVPHSCVYFLFTITKRIMFVIIVIIVTKTSSSANDAVSEFHVNILDLESTIAAVCSAVVDTYEDILLHFVIELENGEE